MTRSKPRWSDVCPCVMSDLMGRLALLTRRWILVVKPPRERPKPGLGIPFSARYLMMGADHGAVDHLERVGDQPAPVEGLQDILHRPAKVQRRNWR